LQGPEQLPASQEEDGAAQDTTTVHAAKGVHARRKCRKGFRSFLDSLPLGNRPSYTYSKKSKYHVDTTTILINKKEQKKQKQEHLGFQQYIPGVLVFYV
jgi:hypothetical protein